VSIASYVAGDEDEPDDEPNDEYQPRAASAKSVKPSLLEGLHSFSPDRRQDAPGKKASELEI